MTKKERVYSAIEFKNPDKIPIWAFNKDEDKGDIISYKLFPGNGDDNRKSDWGYTFENLGNGTMGQPKKPVIPDWDMLNFYDFPDPDSILRFQGIDEFKNSSKKHFLIAEMGISGFNTYMFLRGFVNAMIDFKLKEIKAINLLDKIFEIEKKVIKKASVYGFDAIHFADDWGTQKDLIISPELWIEIFKPIYQEHFKYVHNLGMKVFFHSCGNITSIIPEMHNIGVDVINISQPNVVNINKVSDSLRGKQCFMVPISYQTISIIGKPSNICAEASRLFDKLGTKKGGFIGYIEEYSVMGMSEENYLACWDAFNRLNEKLT
jgi:uroporphyrinogen decarboxylase